MKLHQSLLAVAFVIASMSHLSYQMNPACFVRKSLYKTRNCYYSRTEATCAEQEALLNENCGLYPCGSGDSQIEMCFEDSRKCPNGFLVNPMGVCGRGDDCCFSSAATCENYRGSGQKDYIRVDHQLGFPVLCDGMSDGGGWTVIQRRTSGAQSFEQGWNDYKNGFGNMDTGYWLGLEHVRSLIARGTHEIRFEMVNAPGADKTVVQFSKFSIGPESDRYRLSIKEKDYNSSVSTALPDIVRHDNMKFTTGDSDNDACLLCNCARPFRGGWWFRSCLTVNFNGRWRAGLNFGPTWVSQTGMIRPLVFTEIKIRPVA